MGRNILLIGYNFHPEPTGIGKYSGEKIEWLIDNGYDCTVITSYPYYPYWAVQEPYRKYRFWFTKERFQGLNGKGDLNIYRCPQYVPSNPSGIKRIALDLTFTLSAFLVLLILVVRKRFDIIISIAPAFQLGLLGAFYKKLRGGRTIYHIQDLQVDAAKDLGMIKSKTLLKGLFNIERRILNKADVVSTISEGMVSKVGEKVERPVILFPNWADINKFYPLPSKNALKVEFGFCPSDQVVLYSGAIGEKQGLEMILNIAADNLHNENLKFVICGSGPYKNKLKKYSEERQLSNVIFFPLQPSSNFNAFLNVADVHLVIQKNSAGDLVMPSKLTTILAVGGVPVVTANEESSLYSLVNRHNMGIVVEAENENALAQGIKRALSDENQIIARNARKYALQHLSIDSVMRNFVKEGLGIQDASEEQIKPSKSIIIPYIHENQIL